MYENAYNKIERELRNEEGIANELDYVEQTSWVLFLKYLHDLEAERRDRAELDGDDYTPIIAGAFRWDKWAAPKANGEFDHNTARIGDDLITFVDRELFPYLAAFRQSATSPDTIQYKIGEVFTELRNKFRSGYILRDVLEAIDSLSFNTQAERHELSQLYETRIRRMGNAGLNGGEYYTPRPLIRAMIQVRFVEEHKEAFATDRLCHVMNVSPRGLRAFRSRPASRRQRTDMVLLAHIKEQSRLSLGSYGHPRMTEELKEIGLEIGHRRVGRLMRQNGITVERTHKFKATTDSNHTFNIAPNLLEQNFIAEKPNQKRAGDISYIWTREGWLYLAVILDLHSRRVIGWAVSNRMKRNLAIRALKMAIALRSPPRGCIFHSDRGSQYCSQDYQKILRQHSFQVSMSGKGNCYDNAAVETFFKTIKAELIWRRTWETRRQAETAIFQYINGFYNPRRRHSALGWKSPVAFERKVA